MKPVSGNKSCEVIAHLLNPICLAHEINRKYLTCLFYLRFTLYITHKRNGFIVQLHIWAIDPLLMSFKETQTEFIINLSCTCIYLNDE